MRALISAESAASVDSSSEAGLALPPNVDHSYVVVEGRHKVDALRRCIHATGAQRALVFMNFQQRLKARALVWSASCHGLQQTQCGAPGMMPMFKSFPQHPHVCAHVLVRSSLRNLCLGAMAVSFQPRFESGGAVHIADHDVQLFSASAAA